MYQGPHQRTRLRIVHEKGREAQVNIAGSKRRSQRAENLLLWSARQGLDYFVLNAEKAAAVPNIESGSFDSNFELIKTGPVGLEGGSLGLVADQVIALLVIQNYSDSARDIVAIED